ILHSTFLFAVSVSKWWKCRVSVLRFLQVNLFSNLYYYSASDRVARVEKIIKHLLHDIQLDVREAACGTLSSLLHCGYWKIDDKFLSTLNQWAGKQNGEIMRHAGVLGMCAVVRSCPYSVPDYLPGILMSLCPHASSSSGDLVARTVKKCLSEFKRTHQDSWHEHKERFSEDQLCALDEILVSPNYYI
uniref:Proteasome activator complex subunit 4 C-terminal domain-containing protein n=1 Tax=Romanomermis culicivorax TaxID=13658 RepID=A0A915HGY8_ROMCU